MLLLLIVISAITITQHCVMLQSSPIKKQKFLVNLERKIRSSSLTNSVATSSFVISTTSGRLRGKKVNVDNGQLEPVRLFLGIPYAEPPIGELRWSKTVKKKPWSGTHEATEFGSICPQPRDGPLPDVLLPEWYRVGSEFIRRRSKLMDEDCLFLNIYVPESVWNKTRGYPIQTSPLPVMVYFHGYTYSEGSGNFYDGSVLSSFGSVIVVTFNYRLGVLGFLSTMDENSKGNYGLWDQLMALKWVKSNIKFFGGNPDCITAFGSGAGAASIGLLMLSGHTYQGLFSRAILQSGSALAPWAVVREPRTFARQFFSHSTINCVCNSSKETFECLRNKSWRDIIKVKVKPDLYELAFGPVIDGGNDLISDYPEILLNRGEFTNYDVIIGINEADGFGFLRHRFKASSNSDMPLSDSLAFVSKVLYKEQDFDMDISSFVDAFYKSDYNSSFFIKELLKFFYTNWSDPKNSTSLKQSLLHLYTDREWITPVIEKANYQAKFTHPAFFYVFSHQPGDKTDRSWIKCSLGEEIPYVFGTPLLTNKYPLFSYNFTRKDITISKAVMTYWRNFAKNGDPNEGKHQPPNFLGINQKKFQYLIWKRYDLHNRSYLKISSEPDLEYHYRADKIALWSDFIERLTSVLPKPQFSTVVNPTSTNVYTISPTAKSKTPAKRGQENLSEKADESDMNLQLTMTLSVGFILLFVNIIAFAIVSYYKEKDKYKIENLQSELKRYRKKHGKIKSANLSGSETNLKQNYDKSQHSPFVKSNAKDIGLIRTKTNINLPHNHIDFMDAVDPNRDRSSTTNSPQTENSSVSGQQNFNSVQTPNYGETGYRNHTKKSFHFASKTGSGLSKSDLPIKTTDSIDTNLLKINFDNREIRHGCCKKMNALPTFLSTLPSKLEGCGSTPECCIESKPRCRSALGGIMAQNRDFCANKQFCVDFLSANLKNSERNESHRFISNYTLATPGLNSNPTHCQSVQHLPLLRLNERFSHLGRPLSIPRPKTIQIDALKTKEKSTATSNKKSDVFKESTKNKSEAIKRTGSEVTKL